MELFIHNHRLHMDCSASQCARAMRGRDKGVRGDIKWALKRTFSSAKWMVATAVGPESLISKNVGDLGAIDNGFERLWQLAEEDKVPWSRSHSLFANMGGFVIRCNVPKRVGSSQEAKADPASSTEAGPRDESSSDREGDGKILHCNLRLATPRHNCHLMERRRHPT
jgi:hypothetical protein